MSHFSTLECDAGDIFPCCISNHRISRVGEKNNLTIVKQNPKQHAKQGVKTQCEKSCNDFHIHKTRILPIPLWNYDLVRVLCGGWGKIIIMVEKKGRFILVKRDAIIAIVDSHHPDYKENKDVSQDSSYVVAAWTGYRINNDYGYWTLDDWKIKKAWELYEILNFLEPKIGIVQEMKVFHYDKPTEKKVELLTEAQVEKAIRDAEYKDTFFN